MNVSKFGMRQKPTKYITYLGSLQRREMMGRLVAYRANLRQLCCQVQAQQALAVSEVQAKKKRHARPLAYTLERVGPSSRVQVLWRVVRALGGRAWAWAWMSWA